MNKKKPYFNDREMLLVELNRHRISLGATILDAAKLFREVYSNREKSPAHEELFKSLRNNLRGLRVREDQNYSQLVGLLGISKEREAQIREFAYQSYANGS